MTLLSHIYNLMHCFYKLLFLLHIERREQKKKHLLTLHLMFGWFLVTIGADNQKLEQILFQMK